MVVEVMGRYAGWIALHSGIAGSADVILIPEIPFDLATVCQKIRRREVEGRHFSMKETRTLVLGHLQRGGSPTTFDRLLGLRFGAAAVRLIAEGKFGNMVALRPPTIDSVAIEEALATPKRVPLDSDTIATARDLGISLGD
jgi:6-phosphofructokinase 1